VNNDRVLNVALVILTLCAVTTTGMLVRREVAAPQAAPAPAPPSTVADWRSYARNGHVLDSSDAPVSIVVFSDYQCPYCARLSKELHELRGVPGHDMRIVYRHFPLAGHPFALQAARASECAAAQYRFEALHNALFAAQDSIGKLPWDEFARRAHVPDLTVFAQCANATDHIDAIARDTLAGRRLRIRATPTFLVNETLIEGLPPADTLAAIIERASRRVTRP
jgi:protein-disulfide isomerase